VTFVAYHFKYLLRHLLNRLINLRLITGGASLPGASRDPPLTNAITGIGGCCARAASGHAATPPPRSAMNWRRLIEHGLPLGTRLCQLPESRKTLPSGDPKRSHSIRTRLYSSLDERRAQVRF
jgi:hypothetical protein